jgi:long-chain acyl-CoA synthetase
MNAFDYFFEKTKQLDKLFLVGAENISFIALYNSSLQLATRIFNLVGQNQNIILISENNLFFIKAYLAIIKSGNICVPLDPGIEKENLSYIIRIINPKLTFTTKSITQKLSLDSSNCFFPESINSETDEISSYIPDIKINESDCTEILFTSGSTGRPKGVMISHKNLIANTSSILSYLKLNHDDRMLVVLPFYYCYGLSLLHTHLRSGGSIVLNNSFIFLGKFIRNLIDYNCTGFAGVPSHFQILLRKSDSFKKSDFPALKYVTQAGGYLATTLIDEFRESFPNVKFYVMYGQTEATARLSYLSPEMYSVKKGSIGKGMLGVELQIINEVGRIVKHGKTGEVIARGENIMIGYYKDSEDIENVLKNGWLHTGDLGTMDNDGYIYLTARKKEIIKVGGKRISPKEIESVILQVPDVIDCNVDSISNELIGESIKAKVIIQNLEDKNQILEMIKQKCVEQLAIYKVPRLFEFSTHFSITQTGKKRKY